MACRDQGHDDVGYHVEYRDRPETVQNLCDALRYIEQKGLPIPTACAKWWAAHKKEDAARVAAEQARLSREAKRKAILSKLSQEEKKILGL